MFRNDIGNFEVKKVVSMRIITLLLLLSFLSLQTKALDVIIDHNSFYASEVGTYVETNILIPARQLTYAPMGKGKYGAKVEVTLIFKNNNEIVAFDKYMLNSMEVEHPDSARASVIDKKRFTLPNGVYIADVNFQDVNDPENTYTDSESLVVDLEANAVDISQVEFVDEYVKASGKDIYNKAGFKITPFVLNFFNTGIDVLKFYAEVYLPESISEPYLLTYAVQQYQGDQIINNMKGYQKIGGSRVTPILREFNIAELPTGNYELVLEVRDKQNELISIKKEFFQRYKKVDRTDEEQAEFEIVAIDKAELENSFVAKFTKDEMEYHLLALAPIAGKADRTMAKRMLKTDNLQYQKNYYYSFWKNYAPTNTYETWLAYQKKLQNVQESFGTSLLYGFETDRGRIFLQYGEPNQLQESEMEPGVYPYQIWHYYTTNVGQSNVRFVFLAQDRVTNSYELIHSTAIDEIRNPAWQSLLSMPHNSGTNSPSEYDIRSPNNFGNRVNERFDE